VFLCAIVLISLEAVATDSGLRFEGTLRDVRQPLKVLCYCVLD